MQSGGNGKENSQLDGGSQTEQPMPSENQVLERGQKARDLLNNPMYNELYSYRMEKNLEDMEATKPAHKETREALFQQRMAIKEGPQLLRALVQEAMEVVSQRNDEADPQKREMEYLDQQGFNPNLQ
jgi:hypothetical protein